MVRGTEDALSVSMALAFFTVAGVVLVIGGLVAFGLYLGVAAIATWIYNQKLKRQYAEEAEAAFDEQVALTGVDVDPVDVVYSVYGVQAGSEPTSNGRPTRSVADAVFGVGFEEEDEADAS